MDHITKNPMAKKVLIFGAVGVVVYYLYTKFVSPSSTASTASTAGSGAALQAALASQGAQNYQTAAAASVAENAAQLQAATQQQAINDQAVVAYNSGIAQVAGSVLQSAALDAQAAAQPIDTAIAAGAASTASATSAAAGIAVAGFQQYATIMQAGASDLIAANSPTIAFDSAIAALGASSNGPANTAVSGVPGATSSADRSAAQAAASSAASSASTTGAVMSGIIDLGAIALAPSTGGASLAAGAAMGG